ncbi:MAG: FecR domain-containing protein, partial [Calothrix sp. SM1_5_4]|nr:FecR domain-containing protein [Calothrix sp. SM1_5_4]
MNVFFKSFAFGVLALSALCRMPAYAQNVHGVLRVVKGDVQIKSAKSGQTVKARLGEKVYPKDVIVTAKDARAKIVMVDNNEINVSPESQIEIQHYEFDPKAGKKDVLLNVIYGKVRSKVEQKYDGKTSKFQINDPSAVAGVRGTDFLTSFDRGTRSSSIITFHGKVEFGLPAPNGGILNPVMVTPGNMASSVGGQPPAPPLPMPKDDLAKMDSDTKADTAPKGGEQNAPAPAPGGDGGKKEEPKKEEPKGEGQRTPAAA